LFLNEKENGRHKNDAKTRLTPLANFYTVPLLRVKFFRRLMVWRSLHDRHLPL
jgi:hypothetical protein